jgi:hypothetical protein
MTRRSAASFLTGRSGWTQPDRHIPGHYELGAPCWHVRRTLTTRYTETLGDQLFQFRHQPKLQLVRLFDHLLA